MFRYEEEEDWKINLSFEKKRKKFLKKKNPTSQIIPRLYHLSLKYLKSGNFKNYQSNTKKHKFLIFLPSFDSVHMHACPPKRSNFTYYMELWILRQ